MSVVESTQKIYSYQFTQIVSEGIKYFTSFFFTYPKKKNYMRLLKIKMLDTLILNPHTLNIFLIKAISA